MKTELDKTIIAKVFAQYLGQEVETPYREATSQGLPMKRRVGKLVAVDLTTEKATVIFEPKGTPYDYDFWDIKLQARDLSSITDEEAVEVALMAAPSGSIEKEKSTVLHGTEVRVNYAGCTVFICPAVGNVYIIEDGYRFEAHQQVEIFDYMRSRGFDLPNYYLGGKTPIEAGIAVKKEVNP